MGASQSAKWGLFILGSRRSLEELSTGKGFGFLKDHSDFCMQNGLEEEQGILLRGCDSGPQRQWRSWWWKGGKDRSGNIQEIHVRSQKRWFFIDWMKVLRDQESSRMTWVSGWGHGINDKPGFSNSKL